jgi:hypothetical protein
MEGRSKGEPKSAELTLFFAVEIVLLLLGHLIFAMLNTVDGITVVSKLGRSGSHPDTSPSEVSRQWQAKIPQGEKYEEV